MLDLSDFERAAKALQNSIRCYMLLAERTDLDRWLVSVDEALTQLKVIVEIPTLTRGEKQKGQTLTAQFLSLRQPLRNRVQHLDGVFDHPPPPSPTDQEVIGGELRQQQPPQQLNVSWDYFESAFANRIRSAVISNLGCPDITSFMKEAKPVFVREVGEVMKKHSSIKVNTDLAADFSVIKNEEVNTEQNTL